MPAVIDFSKCYGCPRCGTACERNAITMLDKAYVDVSKCNNCGECLDSCPEGAISIQR